MLYRQNMGDFLEVMTGVSDASIFIDAANAAGIGLGGFSGTLVIPINDVSADVVFKVAASAARLASLAGNFSHGHRNSCTKRDITNKCVKLDPSSD